MIITYKYRIKDSKARKRLVKYSRAVNYVWNYCVETYRTARRRRMWWPSGFDLQKLTSGCSKELGISSVAIQSVCEQFARLAKQHHKIPRFRSAKRSLPWIPFKHNCVKVVDDTVKFNGYIFRFWKSRELPGRPLAGSFFQDTLGNWFVSFAVEVPTQQCNTELQAVGLDLGLTTHITTSNGSKYTHPNFTKQLADELAQAQRAGNKRKVKKIHKKIANRRLDWCHKVTTEIVQNHSRVAVGNLQPQQILHGTTRNTNVYDASPSTIKTMLEYKAKMLGVEYSEVSEAYTTQTCHCCGHQTGPKGQQDLSIRLWYCEHCGELHNRDVNAAINILKRATKLPVGSGMNHEVVKQLPGIPG
jgi:IS605 OrfB family transposase